MQCVPRGPAPVEVVSWTAGTETEECDRIAETIQRLHAEGLPYRDIAVLVRSRAAYPELLDASTQHQLTRQPGWPDRPVLFGPEARLFGKTFAWLVDHELAP